MKASVPGLILLMSVSSAFADEQASEFEAHTFPWPGGVKLRYRYAQALDGRGRQEISPRVDLARLGRARDRQLQAVEGFRLAVPQI